MPLFRTTWEKRGALASPHVFSMDRYRRKSRRTLLDGDGESKDQSSFRSLRNESQPQSIGDMHQPPRDPTTAYETFSLQPVSSGEAHSRGLGFEEDAVDVGTVGVQGNIDVYKSRRSPV